METVSGSQKKWNSPNVVGTCYSSCPSSPRPSQVFGYSDWKRAKATAMSAALDMTCVAPTASFESPPLKVQYSTGVCNSNRVYTNCFDSPQGVPEQIDIPEQLVDSHCNTVCRSDDWPIPVQPNGTHHQRDIAQPGHFVQDGLLVL
jgi:hypothetical protein